MFALIDAFAAKPDRKPLVVNSGTKGIKGINEGTVANKELTVDEYFHTPHWLNLKRIDKMTAAERTFARNKAGKMCHHTIGSVANATHGATVTDRMHARLVLAAGCGFPGNLPGFAHGEVLASQSQILT